MIDITFPESDLAAPGKPYVAIAEVAETGQPQVVEIAIHLQRVETGATGSAWSERQEVALPAGRTGKASRVEVRVGAADLAEGEYTGEIEIVVGEVRESGPFAFFRMPEPSQEPFPFGIYAIPVPDSIEEVDAALKEIRGMGINLLCQHMHNGLEGSTQLLDRAARIGLRFQPSVGMPRQSWPEAQQAQPAEPLTKEARTSPCLNQPAVREATVENLRRRLLDFCTHPGFSGMVYFGDDLFLPMQCQQGHVALTCYCNWCIESFRQRTGQEPPRSTNPRLGILPPTDPWLMWMHYRCADNYGGFVAEIEAAKDAVDPTIQLGLCHGWPDNPFTSVISGLYGPLTQPTSVVSSYCYPFLRSPAQDFICHYEIAKMGNRDKDVWMLGLCAADHTMAPRWQVYQNYWNMLAAGYKAISFFSWWDFVKILPIATEDDLHRRTEAMDALSRCGDHKDWILPTARYWEDLPARHAALFSFTTEAFDISPVNQGNRHSREVSRFTRMALANQVPIKIICEEEIRDGILDQFDSVSLHDVRVLAGDISEKLHDYTAAGKTVMLDSDPLYVDAWHPAVKVPIKGALELSPESTIAYLRDRTDRAIDVSNPNITVRHFRAGTAEYFVFANNYADRYWGMPYTYGDRATNYKHAALVRDEASSATVRFRDADRWLFDMNTGKLVGPTGAALELELEPSWGRVLVALPTDTATLVAKAPAEVVQGEPIRGALSIRDATGETVDAAFTVKITATTPSDRKSRYSSFLGIEHGAGELLLPIGINDETGTWRIQIEGGFPRKTVELAVNVAEATRLLNVLSVKAL